MESPTDILDISEKSGYSSEKVMFKPYILMLLWVVFCGFKFQACKFQEEVLMVCINRLEKLIEAIRSRSGGGGGLFYFSSLFVGFYSNF